MCIPNTLCALPLPHPIQVSLVLATLVRHMPLPTTTATTTTTSSSSPSEPSHPSQPSHPSHPPQSPQSPQPTQSPQQLQPTAAPLVLLPPAALRSIGGLLLRLLFEMKHNGAVEKTATALEVVAERLLRAPNAQLNALPQPWMEVRTHTARAHIYR